MDNKGKTTFEDKKGGEVITTFETDLGDKIVLSFDKTTKITDIQITESGINTEYNPATFEKIPEKQKLIIDSMISLTVWHKLDI